LKRTSPQRIEEYLTLYRQNKTYEQVGKVFGLSGKTIRAVIKSSGRLESRATGTSKTSEETINQYLDLLSKGKTYREVGEIFWLGENSIRSALKNAGKFELRSKKIQNSSSERIEEYLDLLSKGKTYKQVGEVFNLTANTIYGILKRAGRLESRRVGRQKT